MLQRLRDLLAVRKHAGFRRYAGNTLWLFSEQMLRMLAGLLVGIWVARYLGPARFGLFSYAIAFVSLFSSIAKLGLDSVVVRDLVDQPERRDLLLGTAFWLKLVGAFVMLAIVAVAVQLSSSDATTQLYILIISSASIFQAFEVVDFYFQAKVLSKFVSICKLAQLVVSSLIKLGLMYIQADLFWFVLVSLVDQVTLAAALFLAYRYQDIGKFSTRFDRQVAKQLLRDSWPLILSGMVVMVYMRTDQVMIKEMLGEKEVGLYTAAVRLSEVWYFVPVLVSNSVFPALIRARKESEDKYQLRLEQLIALLVWAGFAVALIATLISRWLVVAVYGADYEQASQVLMIHVWSGVFVAMGVVSSSWFVYENLQRYLFYRTLLGAVANVVLNLLLIPRFGIVGAAVATLISQTVAAFLFDLVPLKTRVLFRIKMRTLLFCSLR